MSERLEKPVAGQFIPAEFVQTKAAASLRLDIPCQLGDGLLAFEYKFSINFSRFCYCQMIRNRLQQDILLKLINKAMFDKN